MRRVLFLTIFSSTFLGLKAQKVDNVRAAASGELIIITYDLSGTKPEERFKVKLYSSHNNFVSPVQQVTGDVGDNIVAGKDRRIAWSAKDEMKDFKGSLSFEVRADLIIPSVVPETTPVTPSQFSFGGLSSVKRGSNMQMSWSGGSTTENVKLELLKEAVPQQTVMNSRNTGSYSWSVPSNMKPGTYQLKITGTAGNAVSSGFSIKHKVPTLLKVLPVVVIGGVVAATAGGGGGGGTTTPPKVDLPIPSEPN